MQESAGAPQDLPARVTVRGPHLQEAEGRRFEIRGVTYGPFGEAGEAIYGDPTQVERDLDQIVALGANTLRLYQPPPETLLQGCRRRGLRVLIGIPWNQEGDFLATRKKRETAQNAVRETVAQYRDNPVVLGFVIGNEIQVDQVRFLGLKTVRDFLEALIRAGRETNPEALFTYANFPSTEYLQPRNQDFLSYNVFLHDPAAFEAYARRLRRRAGHKPLVLSEFGRDTLSAGEPAQAAMLPEQVAIARNLNFAGSIVFAFTDEWYRGGGPVEDWAFGLTTRDRRPKAAFAALQEVFRARQPAPSSDLPRAGVIVCAYNAEKTLRRCLESLETLDYPDYEVIVVDDGSTDATARIAGEFAWVRLERIAHGGLSAARNHGARMATGEILVYTDADCIAEPDWLRALVEELTGADAALVGGPNVPPPSDDPVIRALSRAPGGPCEVMLTDRCAEHIPGCNMAMWKWAFDQIGGFDPLFHTAGDDVDFCWRALDQDLKIHFTPRAVVWHPRRETLRLYQIQQQGYGQAEALLRQVHYSRFTARGKPSWKGAIYEQAFVEPRSILQGAFGTSGFPTVYGKPYQSRFARFLAFPTPHLAAVVILALGVWAALWWPAGGKSPADPVAVWTCLFLMLLLLSLAATFFRLQRNRDKKEAPALEDPRQPGAEKTERRTWANSVFYYIGSRRKGRWSCWNKWRRTRGKIPATLFAGLAKNFSFWSPDNNIRQDFLEAAQRSLTELRHPFVTDAGTRSWDITVFGSGAYFLGTEIFTMEQTIQEGAVLHIQLKQRGAWQLAAFTIVVGLALALALFFPPAKVVGRPLLLLLLALGVGTYLAWTLVRHRQDVNTVLKMIAREKGWKILEDPDIRQL